MYYSLREKRKEEKKRFWFGQDQVLPCIELTDDYFKNSSGSIRAHLVRSAFLTNAINKDRVEDLYKKWRDYAEYLALDGYDIEDNYVTTLFVKASKRGNDVFKKRVREKLSKLDKLPPIDFFAMDPTCNRTPMIFVTLTINAKKYTLIEAWQRFPNEFHKFETKLRKKYGKFTRFRVWESHKSGYPHIHVCYYFKEHTFVTFQKKRKSDGKIVDRIPDHDNTTIRSLWTMGQNTDVQGVSDTIGAFSEIKKYVTKSVFTIKSDLTNAMLWVFGKRQYSMSKDFISTIWENYDVDLDIKEPEANALVNQCMHNCNLECPIIARFVYRNVVAFQDLRLFYKKLAPDPWFQIQIDPAEHQDQRVLLGLDSVYEL